MGELQSLSQAVECPISNPRPFTLMVHRSGDTVDVERETDR